LRGAPTGIARSVGLFGPRVEATDELEDALRAAFGHDGPTLADVRSARQELSLPPKLTFGQIKGFTLYASRTILSGEDRELVELARTNRGTWTSSDRAAPRRGRGATQPRPRFPFDECASSLGRSAWPPRPRHHHRPHLPRKR
jgi:hypothetical protein